MNVIDRMKRWKDQMSKYPHSLQSGLVFELHYSEVVQLLSRIDPENPGIQDDLLTRAMDTAEELETFPVVCKKDYLRWANLIRTLAGDIMFSTINHQRNGR